MLPIRQKSAITDWFGKKKIKQKYRLRENLKIHVDEIFHGLLRGNKKINTKKKVQPD